MQTGCHNVRHLHAQSEQESAGDTAGRDAAKDRRHGFSLRRQLRSVAPLGFVWFGGLIILAAARVQTAAPLDQLFLDPVFITGAPWYTGALSNLGIFVWTLGVAFAAAGAWLARRTGRIAASRFLAFGTLATLVLVFDDIFAIHSSVLNDFTWLPRSGALFLVVSPTLIWVIGYRSDIWRTRYLILLAALGCLASSVLLDRVGLVRGENALLAEDGFKFLGILAWTQYFALTTRDIATSAITSHAETSQASGNVEELESEPPAVPKAA